MADNTTLNAGSGGNVVASDDIGGVHYQRVKVNFGADGSATDVATGTGLPVQAARVATATDVALASSTTSAQVLASNTARLGLTLTNTDANTAYVYYGTTATATKFTVAIPTGGYWEMPQPIYTGRIDAVWSADGSGSLIGSET